MDSLFKISKISQIVLTLMYKYIDSRVFAQKLLVAVRYSREQTLKKGFWKNYQIDGKR